jgi:transketolase
MQRAYATALYEILKKDRNVISCLSDSGTDYDELIAREFPDQVVNFGISENNQLSAAAGMAAAGKIPFVYTTGAFIVYRSYEFLRDDVCLQNRNVKLIGMGTGLAWSTLGATHHTTEDLALLRALPNLTVFTPATPRELTGAVQAAYETRGPVYIRMGMSGEEELFDETYTFTPGKILPVREGKDLTVFTAGSILSEVMKAARLLELEGISARVVNVHTVKPLDSEGILRECKGPGLFFSVEEHNVLGGIGTAIADVCGSAGLPLRLTKIGLRDSFAEGFGTKKDVLRQNCLDAEHIFLRISEVVKNGLSVQI